MMVSLHKQARTTPAIRKELAASTKPVREPARQYGISEATVRKWRSRSSTEDRSHTPHRLQTHLTPAHEAIVVYLRKQLLLPLDDLLAVVRELLCDKVSRSGLDRCLRRHGVSNLNDLKPKTPKLAQKAFKQLGCFHIDVKYLPQMADDSRRRYLFVAIDRATRWVFVQIHPNKTAATARRFLDSLQKATPIRITQILTDNGSEFVEHKAIAEALGAEFYFAHPYSSWERGLNENFNGLLRQFIPKGTDLRLITDEDVRWAEKRLNLRPRKCLGFRQPEMVFQECLQVA
jgi:transposase InsO family protein